VPLQRQQATRRLAAAALVRPQQKRLRARMLAALRGEQPVFKTKTAVRQKTQSFRLSHCLLVLSLSSPAQSC
jgi:hypothetical protein